MYSSRMTHKEFRGFIGLGILLVIPLAISLAKQCTNTQTETRLQEAVEIAQEADSIADISKARADSASVEALESEAPDGAPDNLTGHAGQANRSGRTGQDKKKPARRKTLPADMSSPHDRPVESGR